MPDGSQLLHHVLDSRLHKAVFFDAVGTLIHPKPSSASVYARVARRFGSRLKVAEISERFRAAFAKQDDIDRGNGWQTDEARERERWRAIVREVLDDVNDPEACFDALYGHFEWPDSWEVDLQALDLLEVLPRRGLKLGVASNFDSRLHTVVTGWTCLHSLSHRVVSSEVGWRKPAPEFFAALCEVTGLPPEQIVYVGDDWENDCLGARGAGLQAIWLHKNRKKKPDHDDVLQVEDLASLTNIRCW
jgi:putative hydrolase of the HAD superfamily